MGFLKSAMEGVAFAREKGIALRTWASASFVRVFCVIAILGFVLLGTFFGCINYLLTEAKKNSEIQRTELIATGKENSYKSALDTVQLCIDSTKDDPKLHKWYCDEAVDRYTQASILEPKERVNEVIGKLAYGAMKNDISRYLRSLEIDRLIKLPKTSEEIYLNLLLSNIAFGFFIFLFIVVLLLTYQALWVSPNRNNPSL
jgi:hypothetical protein